MSSRSQGGEAASDQPLLELRLPWGGSVRKELQDGPPIPGRVSLEGKVKGHLAGIGGTVPKSFSTLAPLIHPPIIQSPRTHPPMHLLSVYPPTVGPFITCPLFSFVDTVIPLPIHQPSGSPWSHSTIYQSFNPRTHPLFPSPFPHAYTHLLIYPEPLLTNLSYVTLQR